MKKLFYTLLLTQKRYRNETSHTIKVRFKINVTYSRFPYNFLVFYPISVISSAYQRACRALYFKWKLFWKNEKEKEEKEDEDFQLLYYLSYIVMCDIDGLPNHCAL